MKHLVMIEKDIFDLHREFFRAFSPQVKFVPFKGKGEDSPYRSLLPQVTVLVTRSNLEEAEYRSAPRLRLIQLPMAGYDHFDFTLACKYGIPVSGNGGANALSVSEHVFGLALALYRQLFFHHLSILEGRWINRKHSNRELFGKTLGIVGLGRIGTQVARRARAFGMKVLFTDIRPMPKSFLSRYQIIRTTLRDLLKRSDLVTLHVPLTPRTKGMMKTANLRLMKPSSILINTSRGEVVREKDLAACLRRRGIRAAALDVFEKEPLPLDSPLRKLDNVILTPHCAPSFETTLRVRDLICENIRRAVAGRRPLHPLPEKH